MRVGTGAGSSRPKEQPTAQIMLNNREVVWLLCASGFSINQLFASVQAHLMSWAFKCGTLSRTALQLPLSFSPALFGAFFWASHLGSGR
jgi:hypothetical protein